MEKHSLSEEESLVEALQNLQHDPECTAELAKKKKNEGNVLFKDKKYEDAVAAYSEGLAMKSEDTQLNTFLYTNRAAAYYYMKNYEKCLDDVTAAKALTPSHVKAIHRGALCCLEMEKYDDCISWCEEGLKLNVEDETLLGYKEKAEKIKNELLKPEADVEPNLLDRLIRAVKDRGINIAEDHLTEESLVCDYNGISARVQMTVNGEIKWPVLLMYPQYYETDFIKGFNENACFYDQFCVVFDSQPSWDEEKKYTPENLKVYFGERENFIVPVDMMKSLKSAMCHKRFQVTKVPLEFFVICSEYDETFRSGNCVVDA